jgi:hypothetical protein
MTMTQAIFHGLLRGLSLGEVLAETDRACLVA